MLSQTLKDCPNRKREHSSPRVREVIVIGTGGSVSFLAVPLARAAWKVTMATVTGVKLTRHNLYFETTFVPPGEPRLLLTAEITAGISL